MLDEAKIHASPSTLNRHIVKPARRVSSGHVKKFSRSK
jgi:hypothetical protein